MSKKIILFLPLLLFASFLLKVSLLDHNLPSHYVFDTQNFFHAKDLYQLRINEAFTEKDFETSWNLPSKYPLGTSWIYLNTWLLLKTKFDLGSLLQTARSSQLIITVLICTLFSLIVSLPQRIKIFFFALLSCSFIFHKAIVELRVHVMVGLFTFLCWSVAVWGYQSKRFWSSILLLGVLCGFSASCFFTGSVSFCTVPVLLWLFAQRDSGPKFRPYLGFFAALILAVSTFFYFYPSSVDYFKGEGQFFKEGAFNEVSRESLPLHVNGLFVYLKILLGSEPLIFGGYLIALYCLFKTGLWKSPVYLLALSALLPYQVIMAFVKTHHIRHFAATLPLILILSAYGWSWAVAKKGSFKLFFLILVLFMFFSLWRYNYVIQRETRQEAYRYVHQNLPHQTNILVDHLGPSLSRGWKIFPENKYVIFNYRYLPQIFKDFWENDPYFFKQAQQKKLTYEDADDPQKFPIFLEMLNIEYYLANSYWQTRPQCFDASAITTTGQRVAVWNPEPPNHLVNYGSWPLWAIWTSSLAGPLVELYEMPWAHPKVPPWKKSQKQPISK